MIPLLLFNVAAGSFYWLVWRHHRTVSLIPLMGETDDVWLVVRVCVDVWCFSIRSAPRDTVTWRARLGRESETTGHAACRAASSLRRLGLLWSAAGCRWPDSLCICSNLRSRVWTSSERCYRSHGPEREDEGKSQTKSYMTEAAL